MFKAVLHQLSIWIVVIPFLIGIVNFKGLDKDSRWIFFLVTIALIPQLMTAFVANDTPPFNVAYNLYTVVEFLVLFLLFKSKFRTEHSRKWVLASAILYGLIAFMYLMRFGIHIRFIGELVAINNVIYMIWILAIFRQEFGEEETFIELRRPFTWYLIGLVIYAPCTIFTLALYQYLRKEPDSILRSALIIQDIFNILLYILFAVGLFIRWQDAARKVQP